MRTSLRFMAIAASGLVAGAAVAASSTQLTVADTSQSQTSDNLSLTQAHNLTVADTSQSQTSDNLDLVQAHVITIQDITQSQAIHNIVLTQANVLAIQDIVQSMLLDGSINLLTDITLIVADMLQSQTIDNIQWRQPETPIDRIYCIRYDNRIIFVLP